MSNAIITTTSIFNAQRKKRELYGLEVVQVTVQKQLGIPFYKRKAWNLSVKYWRKILKTIIMIGIKSWEFHPEQHQSSLS